MKESNQLVSLSLEDMRDTNGGICIFAIKNLFNNKKGDTEIWLFGQRIYHGKNGSLAKACG